MRSLIRQFFAVLALVSAGWMPVQSQAQVDIGVYISSYPTTMVQIPGYPVYYDPYSNANYFFFDGLYWVYTNDAWYQSSWYNGPWQEVDPYYVPEFLLRVPVRYYRQPPVYFRGWIYDEPPRWGYRWGSEWERRRPGWNVWDRRVIVAPAPLPYYQRHYYGEHYPRSFEHQQQLRTEQYRYAPRERMVETHPQPQPARREFSVTPTQPAPIQHQQPVQQQPPAARREFSVTPTPQAPVAQPSPVMQAPPRQAPVTQEVPRSAPPQSRGREGGGEDRGGRGGERR